MNFSLKEGEPPKQAEEKETVREGPADASVYTFGFGEDHDPDMLKQISDAGNGMYYYIENEDQVHFYLWFEVDFYYFFKLLSRSPIWQTNHCNIFSTWFR